MNDSDLFKTSWDDPNGRPSPDISEEDGLRQRIQQILKSSWWASESLITARVEEECELFAARLQCKWKAEIATFQQRLKEVLADVEEMRAALTDGSIPEHLPGYELFKLPLGIWKRIVFWVMVVLGVSGGILEWANFGYFLRFATDSVPMGLCYALPILLFPIVEAALLHNGLFSNRTLKILSWVQGAIGALSLTCYIYLSFRQTDQATLIQAVTAPPQSLSTDALRMAMQMMTTLCFAAICLQTACFMGITRPAKNREYQTAKKKIRGLLHEADAQTANIAVCEGKLVRLSAIQKQVIGATRCKLSLLNTEQREHNDLIRRILNEPI